LYIAFYILFCFSNDLILIGKIYIYSISLVHSGVCLGTFRLWQQSWFISWAEWYRFIQLTLTILGLKLSCFCKKYQYSKAQVDNQIIEDCRMPDLIMNKKFNWHSIKHKISGRRNWVNGSKTLFRSQDRFPWNWINFISLSFHLAC